VKEVSDARSQAVRGVNRPQERVSLSGIRVREMWRRVELPPPEDSRCEVAAILHWATLDQYRI